MTEKTLPTVCIIESLDLLQEDTLREGEIISRTLRLSDKASQYVYLRTDEELEKAIEEFGQSKHRYLHLSCHGTERGEFCTTLHPVNPEELVDKLAPAMESRRLFISSCHACTQDFAYNLLRKSNCLSVLGPVGEIRFDDAAIFWSSFYHLMFRKNPDRMRSADIEETVTKCARMIGQKFRLFGKKGGEVYSCVLPAPSKPKRR
jgi:hypothetical protein